MQRVHQQAEPSINAVFLHENKEAIHEIWRICDVDTSSVGTLIEDTQDRFVGVEHGSAGKPSISSETTKDLLPVFEEIGLVNGIPPRQGVEHDELIIIGGLMRANRVLATYGKGLLDEELSVSSSMTFFAGRRAVELRDLEHMPHSSLVDLSDEPRNETDLSIIALTDSFGDLGMPETTFTDELGAREHGFKVPGYPDIKVLHGQPVTRKNGAQPRHTTASCTEEWLELHEPTEESNILIVSPNPHTRRVAATVQRVLNEQERGDIHVDYCGPAAWEGTSIHSYLGVIASTVYDHFVLEQNLDYS